MTKKTIKGIVTLPFKTKSKSYGKGDFFETPCEKTAKILINSNRIETK